MFVPLTPNERRRLREIERQLARDDPTFATSMGGHEPPPDEPPNGRAAFWWSLAALAAVAASIVVAIVVDISYAAVLMLFLLATSAFLRVGLRGRVGPPDDVDRHRDT
ncbi:DUF3040 domain-containing protein [Catellatospora citrea]|uniref:DUF3040 domain-containing protein n=1 Tax=Catellatospora citrea TaxID=53366 RepID=UPI003407D5E0